VKLTFLGTGTSFGVPQLGCGCEVCRSPDPRDRRTRVGAVIETDDGTRLLIDTPPELRIQLIAAGISDVDAVIFTHDHADHTHGIDDLRAITVRRAGALPIYGSADTLRALRAKFDYIFDTAIKARPGSSKPEGEAHEVVSGSTFRVGDTDIRPFSLPHGPTSVMGYRIGPLGYITDAKALTDEALAVLKGVSVLVINALFKTEHPSHFSIPEAVAAAQAIGADRTFLTHLTHRTAHADLEAELPRGIAPAFDGLTLRID
jgi:phosphoribosyl 1,2-cyclic phosphate phosphodiesterase